MLFEGYWNHTEIIDDKNEDLIEPIEDIVDDILTTHIGIVALMKNDRKQNINNTKDEYHFVDCRFIFRSTTRAKIFLRRFKYTKTESKNRLTPQILKLFVFWKAIEKFENIFRN